MTPVQIVNQILSALVVASDIFLVVWIIALAVGIKNESVRRAINWFGRYAVPLAFVVALVSMSGSLFYSEFAGYNPCKLCWYQRIFMYSQVFILVIAMWRKHHDVVDYSIGLSLFGGLIAAYHYWEQITDTPLPCSVIGASASCSQRFVLTYGYITIPMMALTGFLLILALMISRKLSK